eukprot:8371991-Pyramimonas_sp.AAC.1
MGGNRRGEESIFLMCEPMTRTLNHRWRLETGDHLTKPVRRLRTVQLDLRSAVGTEALLTSSPD